MKNVITSFSLLLLPFFVGCEQQKSQNSYETFQQEISLQAEKVPMDSTILMRYPFRIHQQGEYLYIMDLHGEEGFFHIFDNSHYNHIASFGIRGEGPMEILSAENIQCLSSDALWVLDSGKHQLSQWQLSPDSNKVIRKNVITINRNVARSLDFAIYDSTTFLIPDYSGKSRLCLVNNHGELIEEIGTIPVRKPIKESMEPALAQAWRSFVCYNPQNKIIAIATQLGDVVEIFNQNTGMHKVLYGPYGEPAFKVTSEGYSIPTGIMGYSDIQITNHYIYAVFHGRTFKEIAQMGAEAEDGGRYIHVFDFEGNPVRRYTLDHAVYGIHVDEDEETLWATNVNDEDQVLKYKL